MSHRKRTEGEAARLLVEYENLNKDIPKSDRRQMAMFFLAPKVGRKTLEELFQRPLGQTPFRHRCWFWWKMMSYSNIGHLWGEFADLHNMGICTHHCLRWLKGETTEEEWIELSRRYGAPLKRSKTNRINVNWWKPTPRGNPTIWTKGGEWPKGNNFTRIIILGEHIERTDWNYNQVTRALEPADCLTLERELSNLYDPDSMLAPHIIKEAVQYVRHRIPRILLYKRDTTSYKTTSWFFQTHVPHPDGGFLHYTDEVDYPRKRMKTREHGQQEWFIDWLPPEDS